MPTPPGEKLFGATLPPELTKRLDDWFDDHPGVVKRQVVINLAKYFLDLPENDQYTFTRKEMPRKIEAERGSKP